MAQVLEARERLSAIVDASVASGWSKKETVRSHLSSLRRQARMDAAPGDREPGSSGGSAMAELREMGFEVVKRG